MARQDKKVVPQTERISPNSASVELELRNEEEGDSGYRWMINYRAMSKERKTPAEALGELEREANEWDYNDTNFDHLPVMCQPILHQVTRKGIIFTRTTYYYTADVIRREWGRNEGDW